MSSDTPTRWQTWAQRFAALQPREKGLIATALAFAVVAGGYGLWIEPGRLQVERLEKTLAQQRTEQAQLEAQIGALTVRAGDPDASTRAALQSLRAQLDANEREIAAFGHTLVPPQRIPALLQTLLAQHRGLALVSVNTLPPVPLIELPAGAKTEARPAPGGNLYRHGIEIRLAGSYHDLLAYVAELDASPYKLSHGRLALTVKEYPVSEQTLTLYTLSLDSTWLVV